MNGPDGGSTTNGGGCITTFYCHNNLWCTIDNNGVGSGNTTYAYVSSNAFWSAPNSISGINYDVKTGDPFTDWENYDFTLTAYGATNMNAGTSIANFGIHTFNIDMDGNTRNNWTRGALEYVSATQVSQPVFSPVGNTSFCSATNVLIYSITDGAKLHWTTNNWSATNYVDASNTTVNIQFNSGLQAFATNATLTQSTTRSNYYWITNCNYVAPVVVTPASATFLDQVYVTNTCSTDGASIHYTLDGTNPNETSLVYNSPVAITSVGTNTFIAFAHLTGYTNSPFTTNTYIITNAPAVLGYCVFTPAPGGTNTNEITITITNSAAAASIFWSTNAWTTTNSYTNPLLFYSTVNLYAYATLAEYADSPSTNGVFTIVTNELKVITPTFDPVSGGTYNNNVIVEISCLTPFATIHYFTNGTTNVYSSTLQFFSTVTVNAYATLTDYIDSDLATASYTITNDLSAYRNKAVSANVNRLILTNWK